MEIPFPEGPSAYPPTFEADSSAEVSIGKLKKNSFTILGNASISGAHATISPDGQFTDSSTNGSYILIRSGEEVKQGTQSSFIPFTKESQIGVKGYLFEL